jgi:predicted nuclease of predicted toxin-antitoxin system
VRFFIDEDLSPQLVDECHRAGYDATSVRDRDMLRATDREVAKLCFAEDRVLVTNNATDFLKLAEEEGMHPGLVFLPLGSRAEMRSWMATAIGAIEELVAAASIDAGALMINNVLDVDEGGRCELFEHPRRTT